MFCDQCGTKMNENSKFCPKCGCIAFIPDDEVQPVVPVRTAAPVNTGVQYHAAPSKKVTGLTIVTMVFTVISLGLLSLGITGIITKDNDWTYLIVTIFGLLLLMPALILGLVGFFTGIRQYKRTGAKADFILRGISFAMVILPILAVICLVLFRKPLAYNSAMKQFEKENYVAAYESFNNLPGYKDSEMMADMSFKNALKGSWKGKDRTKNAFIRVVFDDYEFRADVLIDGEIFSPESFSAAGLILITDKNITLTSGNGETYLVYTYTIENGELILKDKDGVYWEKYE